MNALYSHKNESVRNDKVVSLPCKRLLPYFAFVFRSCDNGVVCEYLVDKTVVVYKIVTDHKCHDSMSYKFIKTAHFYYYRR